MNNIPQPMPLPYTYFISQIISYRHFVIHSCLSPRIIFILARKNAKHNA